MSPDTISIRTEDLQNSGWKMWYEHEFMLISEGEAHHVGTKESVTEKNCSHQNTGVGAWCMQVRHPVLVLLSSLQVILCLCWGRKQGNCANQLLCVSVTVTLGCVTRGVNYLPTVCHQCFSDHCFHIACSWVVCLPSLQEDAVSSGLYFRVLLLCFHLPPLQQVLNINTHSKLDVSTKDYTRLKNSHSKDYILYNYFYIKFLRYEKSIEMENRLVVTSG